MKRVISFTLAAVLLTSCAQLALAISGKDYAERIRREGIGAPVLAERDSRWKTPERRDC